MKYFDPARPRICNRPAYIHEGRAIAPLPHLLLEPNEAGGYTITIMIVDENLGGSWHYREVPDSAALIALLADWNYDPESVLLDFGWVYREPGRLREPARAELSLEDLDDDSYAPEGAVTLDLSDLED